MVCSIPGIIEHHPLMNTLATTPAVKAFHIPLSRERFLRSLFKASAGFMLPGFLAEALSVTPTVTQGPYYPLADDIPLDKDNDLVRLGDSLTLATGVIEHISGTVYDAGGSPVKGALVELWAADHQGDYLYSTGAGRNAACDANFAGFGQFLTGSTGKFRFRTIKAGLYVGRTRHYHWGITLPGRYMLSGSVEYRRPIYANARPTSWDSVIFLDAGNVADTPAGLRKLKYGAGAGALWRSPVGPVQLALAYGLQDKKLRLHMNLGFNF